jgi:uncharacterized membrane protein
MDFHTVQWRLEGVSRPSPSWPRRVGGSIIFLLAIAVALVSYRYLFGLPPVPSGIANNRYRAVWLTTHASFAATALLIGVVQFRGAIRVQRPALHRVVGRIYVVSCLVGAGAGLVLAIGSSAGPVAATGFGGLAITWMLTTAIGWRCVLRRQFDCHRRWMIRSWALTLSGVTLRLYIPLFEAAGLPEMTAYRAISFLCWVPNLLISEVLLRRSDGQ